MEKSLIQEQAFAMIGALAKPKYDVLTALRAFRAGQINALSFNETLITASRALGEVGKLHLALISAEAQGETLPFSLISVHAEDQYMSLQLLIEVLQIWIHP